MGFGSWIGLRFGQSATSEIFVIEKAAAGRSLRWPKCRANPEPKIEADLAKLISGITILDTNVVSEPMQPLPSAIVAAWLSQQPSGALFMTTVTVAEILYGIELLPQGKRRAALLAGTELIATLDAQIVAIAYSRDATLATRNTADFEGCGVRLTNPWQPEG
jgi:toxin FitB